MHKISIIGAGDIGFNLAEILALQGYDVIIYNRYHAVDDIPSPYWLAKMGKVMDMNDSLQIPQAGRVKLTSNLQDLDDSEICVITAGAKRTSSDESREELAGKNALIVSEFVPFIAKNSSMLTMVISNPVDFLGQYLIESVASLTKISRDQIGKKIIGVTYIDSMRLINIIKSFLQDIYPNLTYSKVEAIALGEHGPSMVPITSSAKIDKKPLTDYANSEQLNNIILQTIVRGNDIIKLTGTSSIMGPAHAVMFMINSLFTNEEIIMPCSVWDGKRSIGKLGSFFNLAVKAIIEPDINEYERQKLINSEKILDHQYNKIISILNDLHL